MAITPTGQEAFTRRWEREQALAWLRRAVEVGSHNYPWFQKDKNYDSLRGNPEYQRIREEVRQHWEQYKQTFGVS
jgi:hypothetical protein